MDHGLERLPDLPLSVRLIRELHERLLRDMPGSRSTPGELRRSQNWIGPAGCAPRDAVFVSSPFEEAPRALGDLETSLHRDDDLPPLVRTGTYPIRDGSSLPRRQRPGGAVVDHLFSLRKKNSRETGPLHLAFFSNDIEPSIMNDFRQYATLAIGKAGWRFSCTAWRRLATKLSRQPGKFSTCEICIAPPSPPTSVGRNGHRALESLCRKPVVTIYDVREIADLIYPAANNLIERLVSIGILERFVDRKRNRAFLYRDYIRVFADDPEPVPSDVQAA